MMAFLIFSGQIFEAALPNFEVAEELLLMSPLSQSLICCAKHAPLESSRTCHWQGVFSPASHAAVLIGALQHDVYLDELGYACMYLYRLS